MPICKKLGNLDGLFGDAALQSLTLEEFHGDERPALEVADIVNGEENRMVQRGCAARSRRNRSIDCASWEMSSGKFQGHTSAQAGVLGLQTTPIPPPPSFSRTL